MIRLCDIVASDFYRQQERENLDKITLQVKGEPVWDYKVQNGELRLIHEKVKGSENYEKVTLHELVRNLTVKEGDCPIVSESDSNSDFSEVEILTYPNGNLAINLK